jgi:hypothetical protein
MSAFSESERADIETFNETLTTACTGRFHVIVINLNFVKRCSDGKRRSDIQDYLDFLFPPSIDTYIAQQTSQYTDRTIALKDSVTTHLEFVITLNT